jgi:hypothetical protein
MNKRMKISVGIAALIFIVAIGSMLFINKPEENNKTVIPQVNADNKIILMIDSGDGNKKEISVEFIQGNTVFDILKTGIEDSEVALETQNYDVGVLVKTIGDKENGEGGKYWLYYVNGEMPQVSIDKKEVNLGDKIEFKFENSPY